MVTSMFSKACGIAAIVITLLFGAGHASASTGPGTAAVQKANTELTKLLSQKVTAGSAEEAALAAKVTTQLRTFLDVDELGRAALKAHWGAITAAEQAEYLKLLRTLIEGEYTKALRANVTYTVKYNGESTLTSGDVLVTTEIGATRKGRPQKIKLDYVLTKTGGSLRAYDVKTDGVSLVDNYRAQFDKLIAKSGMQGLLAKLRKKAGVS